MLSKNIYFDSNNKFRSYNPDNIKIYEYVNTGCFIDEIKRCIQTGGVILKQNFLGFVRKTLKERLCISDLSNFKVYSYSYEFYEKFEVIFKLKLDEDDQKINDDLDDFGEFELIRFCVSCLPKEKPFPTNELKNGMFGIVRTSAGKENKFVLIKNSDYNYTMVYEKGGHDNLILNAQNGYDINTGKSASGCEIIFLTERALNFDGCKRKDELHYIGKMEWEKYPN